MAVDLNRIIQAAAEAALQDQASAGGQQQDGKERKGKGLTAPRALLIGAGIATAGRLLVRARGSNLLDNLQQRLAAFESDYLGGGDDEPEDEEYEEEPEGEVDEAEEPEGEYDEEEEPEGEVDDEEEPEGEYDEEEEPEGEVDDEEEPEGEYDEDEEAPEDDEEPAPPPKRSRRAAAGGRRRRS